MPVRGMELAKVFIFVSLSIYFIHTFRLNCAVILFNYVL
jgi:hypothetical protein